MIKVARHPVTGVWYAHDIDANVMACHVPDEGFVVRPGDRPTPRQIDALSYMLYTARLAEHQTECRCPICRRAIHGA